MGGFTQDDGYVQGVAPMHDAPRNPSRTLLLDCFGQTPILPYNWVLDTNTQLYNWVLDTDTQGVESLSYPKPRHTLILLARASAQYSLPRPRNGNFAYQV